MDDVLDLRSDTVTRPTEAMRRAMAEAPVGDDVYGEDPSVRRLEETVAELVGKPAALFVPSGSMGNAIAMLLHTRRGDEVVVGEGAHCMDSECGAAAAWAGVQFAIAGRGGLFSASDVVAATRPPLYHLPRTSLVAVENTHNLAGGRVFPHDDVLAVAEAARARGLALHLDGARIWNASVASERPVHELCAPFDTVGVCFSKGLGAPVGSALCGDAERVAAARRFRKMLGGGMRQAGVLAAAAQHALLFHRERLAEDHAAARALGAALLDLPGVVVPPVETNMVLLELGDVPAERLVRAARERGVLVGATGPHRVRAVTHLDLPAAAVPRAIDRLRAAWRDARDA